MKKMITAVAALLLSTATFAQTATTANHESASKQATQRIPLTPEQRAKKQTEDMNSLAALGSAYDKVLAVNTDYCIKKQNIKGSVVKEQTKEEADAQRAKIRTEMDALNATHKKDLVIAMGPDLHAKYEAAMKARKEERKEARQQAAPAAK